jgi:hypothetical protein
VDFITGLEVVGSLVSVAQGLAWASARLFKKNQLGDIALFKKT